MRGRNALAEGGLSELQPTVKLHERQVPKKEDNGLEGWRPHEDIEMQQEQLQEQDLERVLLGGREKGTPQIYLFEARRPQY